jgi:hypothetical protein
VDLPWVGAILRQMGFAHVACSHEAPMIKLLPRAQTAVVDAYLAPVIGDYLRRVADAMGEADAGRRLMVLTSAGSLVEAKEFRARESLLSGPAGGVVGARLAALRSGITRAVSFDMGGTSTDVARLDAKMREDTFAEPANSYAALAAKGPTLLPKLAAEVTALRVELADAREVNAELRRQAEHDKRRDELAHVELATLREERGRLRAEHDAIGRAIDEAGIGVNGPDDTLVARVDRLIADANEEGDKLEALREKARAVCEADAALIERIDLDTCDAVNDAIDALRAEVDKP